MRIRSKKLVSKKLGWGPGDFKKLLGGGRLGAPRKYPGACKFKKMCRNGESVLTVQIIPGVTQNKQVRLPVDSLKYRYYDMWEVKKLAKPVNIISYSS